MSKTEQTDRVFAEVGNWALASDGIQWMLCRRATRKSGSYWKPIWFVRSDRDVLARGMRTKGVDESTARLLLGGLPDTFDEWKCQITPAAEAQPIPEVPLPLVVSDPVKPSSNPGSFDRLWHGDGVLTTWQPTGSGETMPDIPDFLRRMT